MIVNCELVEEYIANWLAEYAKKNHKSLFITAVRLENRSDYLVKDLCAKATAIVGGLKLETITVMNSLEEEYMECNMIASKLNGIVVGSIDRTYGFLTRKFGKRAEGAADVFPLLGLEYSEVIQITDLSGLSFTQDPDDYSHYEFCNRAEAHYGIITNEDPPHKHPRWPYFTGEQKKWIAETHQREKRTRHKIITQPFPYIADRPQLCKRTEP